MKKKSSQQNSLNFGINSACEFIARWAQNAQKKSLPTLLFDFLEIFPDLFSSLEILKCYYNAKAK